jgi:hypothetical protein
MFFLFINKTPTLIYCSTLILFTQFVNLTPIHKLLPYRYVFTLTAGETGITTVLFLIHAFHLNTVLRNTYTYNVMRRFLEITKKVKIAEVGRHLHNLTIPSVPHSTSSPVCPK